MSVPKSKVLSASLNKGVIALADTKLQSPSQSQIINLTVNSDKNNDEKAPVLASYPDENPYNDVKTTIEQDGTYTSDARISVLESNISDKDKMIEALSLIIELLESNPLIVNKYVIASHETLQELILLLTNADSIEINVNDVGCNGCIPHVKTMPIEKIYINKNGKIYQLKYDYPEIQRILDVHRISTKLTY